MYPIVRQRCSLRTSSSARGINPSSTPRIRFVSVTDGPNIVYLRSLAQSGKMHALRFSLTVPKSTKELMCYLQCNMFHPESPVRSATTRANTLSKLNRVKARFSRPGLSKSQESRRVAMANEIFQHLFSQQAKTISVFYVVPTFRHFRYPFSAVSMPIVWN